MYDMYWKASTDGRLESALKDAKAGKADSSDVEELRNMASSLLLEASLCIMRLTTPCLPTLNVHLHSSGGKIAGVGEEGRLFVGKGWRINYCPLIQDR